MIRREFFTRQGKPLAFTLLTKLLTGCRGNTLVVHDPTYVVDFRQLETWSVNLPDKKWKASTEGLWRFSEELRYSLLCASTDGTFLVVLEWRSDRPSLLTLCQADGTVVSNMASLTIGPELNDVHLRPTGEEILAMSRLSGQYGVCIWNRTEKRWRLVVRLSDGNNTDGVTADSDAVVFSNKGGIYICNRESVTTPERIASGDTPRISPDGTLLYFRDRDGFPALCSWPSLKKIPTEYRAKVQLLAQWHPTEPILLLDRERFARLNLVCAHLQSGRETDLGYVQPWGTAKSGFAWINWGPTGPDALRQFDSKFEQTRLQR